MDMSNLNNFNLNSALFSLLVVWSVIWKGFALWYAARNKQLAWFIALIVINTAGIFEILYLVFFRRNREVSK